MYEEIRNDLTEFYFDRLPQVAKEICDTVFGQMDEFDRAHPGQTAYALKGELYRTITKAVRPKLFDGLPFFFETGALVAISDGRYCKGGMHANGWLYLRNEHYFREVDPHAYDVYNQNKEDRLYCQTGSFVDMMHNGLPMKKLFAVGLRGIAREIDEALAEELTAEEREFLVCAKEGIAALDRIREAFAARALAEGREDIYAVASRVPWEAPGSYHEGLCTMAFLRKALGALEGVGFNSFGRADVLLAPLYEKDRQKGVSEEELLELTCKFLLIWDCALDTRKLLDQPYAQELENTLTLGGCDKEGKAVFHEVTKLFLLARKATDAVYPKMMLRYSYDSPEEYLEWIGESLLESKNFSLFENDATMIPALIKTGVEKDDAVDYVVGGCWDAITPDYSNKFSGEYMNILRLLEWSIHRKTEAMERNELTLPDLEGAEDFDTLYRRYLQAVKELLWRKAGPMAAGSRAWVRVNPMPAFSALMVPPIQKRRDITDNGGKYNRECVYFTNFAEVVDSLLAIRELCFRRKVCTVAELFEACRQDFPDESLRQAAIRCPSFGDGSEESSRFAGEFYDALYDLIQDLPTSYGGKWRMGFNQYTEIIYWAEDTLATPNGRRRGEFLSQGMTPSRLQKPGALTDVVGSWRSMDMTKCAGNASMSLTLPGGKFDKKTLTGFLRAVSASGIQGLQPSMVKKEDLLEAQKHPEQYRHIIVRVCGFSAPFVCLSPKYQAEFLARSFYE